MSGWTKRRRWLVIAVGTLGALAAAWLLYYAVIFDFPAYVEQLQLEEQQELLEAVGDLAFGDGEAAVRRAEALRERTPAVERLSDEDAARVADSLAEVGIVELDGNLFRLLAYMELDSGDAEARCREGLEVLAARRGWHARLVIGLNLHRCDELIARSREDLGDEALRARAQLTEAQRTAIDAAVRDHGGLVTGAALRIHQHLGEAHAARRLLEVAEAVAEIPSAQHTRDAIRERVFDFAEGNDFGDCSVEHNLEGPRYVALWLECMDEFDYESDAPLGEETPRERVYVDLVRGVVLHDRPAAVAERWDAEGEDAIDELARRLREATSPEGELPHDEEAAPFLDIAMDRSGCIVTYEPLGYYEEADLRAVCPNCSFTVHVVAAAATGEATTATQ